MLAYGLEADRPITSDKSDYTPLAARSLPQKPRRWQPKLLPTPYPPRVPCLCLRRSLARVQVATEISLAEKP